MMNSLRKWIRFAFGFSRRETNGFLVLLFMVLGFMFSRPVYRWANSPGSVDFTEENRYLDSLMATTGVSTPTPAAVDTAAAPAQALFRFDPNTVSAAQWVQLGLKQWMADRIIRYREKGGKFRIKKDLLKIYGFDPRDFERLSGYIALPDTVTPVVHTRRVPERPEPRPLHFDLNTADTTAFKKIYGIGPVLAKRIVGFRDRLGGFVSPEQLYEVYHLDSLVARRLMAASYIDPDFMPSQIRINEATEDELAAHPYLSRSLARLIVAYRFQHGPFEEAAEIRAIKPLTEQIFTKLEPYLAVH